MSSKKEVKVHLKILSTFISYHHYGICFFLYFLQKLCLTVHTKGSKRVLFCAKIQYCCRPYNSTLDRAGICLYFVVSDSSRVRFLSPMQSRMEKQSIYQTEGPRELMIFQDTSTLNSS